MEGPEYMSVSARYGHTTLFACGVDHRVPDWVIVRETGLAKAVILEPLLTVLG